MTIDYDNEVSTVLELAYAVTNIEIDPSFPQSRGCQNQRGVRCGHVICHDASSPKVKHFLGSPSFFMHLFSNRINIAVQALLSHYIFLLLSFV